MSIDQLLSPEVRAELDEYWEDNRGCPYQKEGCEYTSVQKARVVQHIVECHPDKNKRQAITSKQADLQDCLEDLDKWWVTGDQSFFTKAVTEKLQDLGVWMDAHQLVRVLISATRDTMLEAILSKVEQTLYQKVMDNGHSDMTVPQLARFQEQLLSMLSTRPTAFSAGTGVSAQMDAIIGKLNTLTRRLGGEATDDTPAVENLLSKPAYRAQMEGVMRQLEALAAQVLETE